MRKTDRVPVPALWRLGIELPGDARLFQRRSSMPLRVELTDELLWFLGLWVAEGSWYEGPNGGFITLSADEALLGRARAIAERAFGINGSLQPGSKARCAQLALHSKLLLRFMEHLGFGPGDKGLPGWILGLPLERLKWVLEGYREGDGVHSGRHFDEGVRHEFSTTSTALKDDLVVAFARFGLVPSVGRYASHRDGRTFPFWRLTLAHLSPWSPLAWDAGVEQRLQARRHGDLVWVKVREIEEVPATELVYDFSVPGVENFWAGTGVLAHNTYGPRMRAHDGRAIPTFLRQALTNRPITVFGEGRQTRSFCYVSDLIDGMIRLGESGHHDPVNIGNPDEFTLLELAEQVIEVTGSSSEIVFEALPTDDPQVRRPDTRKAQELLGWHPTVKLREGLQRTIEQSEHGHLIGLDR
jgi:hypothetical protein